MNPVDPELAALLDAFPGATLGIRPPTPVPEPPVPWTWFRPLPPRGTKPKADISPVRRGEAAPEGAATPGERLLAIWGHESTTDEDRAFFAREAGLARVEVVEVAGEPPAGGTAVTRPGRREAEASAPPPPVGRVVTRDDETGRTAPVEGATDGSPGLRVAAVMNLLMTHGSPAAFPSRERTAEELRKAKRCLRRHLASEERARAEGDEYRASNARFRAGLARARLTRMRVLLDGIIRFPGD